MTLDGFLTFLTLIVGAYSIAEQTLRLRIRLKAALLLVICVTGFALVCHIEYFALGTPPCPAWLGPVCTLVTVHETATLTVGQLTFAVVVVWALLCIVALTSRGISIWSLPTLRKLISELAVRRKFAELIDAAGPHVPLVSAIVKAKHERGRLQFAAAVGDADASLRNRRSRLDVEIARRTGWLADVERAAEQVLRELLHDDELTAFIARYRPSFGVLLLDTPGPGVYEFSDAYMEALISVSGSTLYAEVKDNQNLTDRGGYAFPEENQLLHYLFGDARNAERLAVWKPVPAASLSWVTAMCFSATASFTAAGLTATVGAICLSQVRRPSELLLAAVPLVFAAQLSIEGLLWLRAPQTLAASTALAFAYLMFAQVLWPTYAPTAAILLEPDPRRRRWMAPAVGLGLTVSGFLLWKLLTGAHTAVVRCDHMVYVTDDVPITALGLAYLTAVCAPLLMSSQRAIVALGVIVLVGAIVAYVAYFEALASVWCFFAALASRAILWRFHIARAPAARLSLAN